MAPDPRAKVAVILGTGYGGEDVFWKEPWLSHLPSERVMVASRIDPDVHLAHQVPVRGLDMAPLRDSVDRLRRHARIFEIGHHAPPPTGTAQEWEEWLGRPLRFLTSSDRRFVARDDPLDSRDRTLVEKAAIHWVSFFRSFFEKHRPDVFIHTIEDDIFSMSAYHVAKRLGVPVVSMQVGRFPGRGWMFCDDFGPFLPWRDELPSIGSLRSLYSDDTITGSAYTSTRGYWDLRSLATRLREAGFVTTYRSFRRHVIDAYPLEAAIIPDVSLLHRAARHMVEVGRRRQARRAGRPSEDVPYVLFPLHYEDDAQLTFREPFLDQMQVVRCLARALPSDTWLYIKPHPHYYGTDQKVGDLRRIARLPRVRIVDPSEPPLPLARRSLGVVTVNSTLGFEALVHGVPVVSLGNDFYCRQPPTRHVQDLRHLPQAVVDLRFGRHPVPSEAVERFVAATFAATIPVQGADRASIVYGLTQEDGKSIAAALEETLARRSDDPPLF